MIKVIVGEKGLGKTKALLDSVHKAVECDHGSVVFIADSKRHVFDLNYKIRMIDTSEFDISNFEQFYGILCGVISQNYDITHIFVDSITKIANGTLADIAKFLDMTQELSSKFSFEALMTVSMSAEEAGEDIKKYMV